MDAFIHFGLNIVGFVAAALFVFYAIVMALGILEVIWLAIVRWLGL